MKTDTDLYRELGELTKNKAEWKTNICLVGALLEGRSPKVTAKAIWLLGEMGLRYPREVASYVGKIASFLDSGDALLRERALNALGRIGRADFEIIRPHMEKMFERAADSNPRVRMSLVWASENIATNTPEPFERHLPEFALLLHDSDDRVRMEAPEIFRVLGKRRPRFVVPYLDDLQSLAENDANRIVRIHSAGAIRITRKALKDSE